MIIRGCWRPRAKQRRAPAESMDDLELSTDIDLVEPDTEDEPFWSSRQPDGRGSLHDVEEESGDEEGIDDLLVLDIVEAKALGVDLASPNTARTRSN